MDLTATSQLLSADVDMDGCDELLFGTYNHSLIVLDVPSGIELVNMSFDSLSRPEPYPYVAVGNLDPDPGQEILFYDGVQLHCIDFRTLQIQWSCDIQPAIGGFRSQGPMTLVDPDGDGTDDILLRTIDQFYRLDGDGKTVYNTSLDVFDSSLPANQYLGLGTRMLLDDFDDDGEEEVFISDWGWSSIPEIYYRGHHVWIIDLTTGVIEFSNDFNTTIFMSDPVLFSYGGGKYIAIGLEGDMTGKELLMINTKDLSWETIDVCTPDNLTVVWLSIIPSEDDVMLLLGGDINCAIAWSFKERRVIWNIPGVGSAFIESPIVICDIDDDEGYEALLPIGPVHVIDSSTGELEKNLDIHGPMYGGARTTVGDFDGDGYIEICQGLFFRLDEGYEIVYLDTDIIVYDIEGPTNGTPTTLYSGIDNLLSIFIRNMTEHRLPSAIEVSVSNTEWNIYDNFFLDLINETIETSTEGPLALTGYTLEYTSEGAFLNLSLLPSWNFSFEGSNDLTVSFVTDRGPDCQGTVKNLFVVERDLVLIGNISIQGSDGPISEVEWLLPFAPLKISGLDVVYQGTDDLHPPRDAFILELFDGMGWSNASFSEGEPLALDLMSPEGDGEFRIVLRLYQPPAEIYGLGSFEFKIRVDNTAPYVVDHFPHNTSWSCDHMVTIALLMADGGCGVDPSSVELCTLRDLNSTGRVWQRVSPQELSETGEGLVAQVEISFAEGSTYVLWRFSDRLGHDANFTHVVNVDLQGILFGDFSPTGWVRYHDVNVSVRVTDRGGSGVDASSLEWSFSHGSVFGFSEWMPVTGSSDPAGILLEVHYVGVEGTSNLIRFRGSDVAGNERTSKVFTVRIDTIAPEIVLVEPDNGSPLDPSIRRARISIADAGSGVSDTASFKMVDLDTGATWTPRASILETLSTVVTYDITWDAVTGYRLSLEVDCGDIAGNRNASVFTLVFDRPPVITGLQPENGASYVNGTQVNFTVVYEEPDGGEVTVEWWLGDVLLSREASFGNSSLPTGNHSVRVVLRDAFHEVVGYVNITITKAPEPPEEPPPEEPDEPPDVEAGSDGPSPWWLVLIVVIIVTAGIVVHQRLRSSKR